MTNSEVLTLMMARLAGRTAASTRALLLQELNQRIQQLEMNPLKPFFLEDTYSGNCVATQNYIDLPTDFLEEYEDGAFRIGDMDGVWQDPDPKKVNIEVLERETDGLSGIPEGYSLYGSVLYLGPTPDAEYPFKLKYYKRTGEIADNTDPVSNPWLINFFNFVTLSTLHLFALTHLQGTEIAAKIMPELQIAADGFARAVESRKHVNMDYLLGDTEN